MNPLALFRKYQKTMLAIAAGGAMLAFGVLPILSDWMGQSGGRGPVMDTNTVAVSWSGGELREGELQNQRVLRSQLRAFQRAVVQRTVERGGQPRIVVVPDTSSESSVVESILLAREAERMGIRIGDDAVLKYLTQHLANDTMDRNELARLLVEATGGNLSQPRLFDAIRTEMAAHQIRVMANGSAFDGRLEDTSVSPGQAFAYFKRLYRRMEAEVIELPAEDYLADVTEEPAEAEIAELYDEYKDTYPSPITPTPGFKEPMRIAFQWVKADFPTILDREVAKITDEEIQAYYDENKSSYKKLTAPSLGDLSGFDDESADPLTDSQDAVEAEEPATDEPAETSDDSAEEAAAEEGAAEDADVEAADVDEVEAGNGQDELEETATDEASDSVTASDDAADEEASAETTEEAADEVTVADTESTDTASPDTEAAASEESEEEAEEVVEYRPIEEVRDDIARTLARPKATEAIRTAVQEVIGEMKSYFEDYMYWDTTPEEERGEQPSPPDLKAVTERLGLVSGTIPLISALEADEYELGRAFELDFSTGQIRRIPFTSLGFSPATTLYDPQKISASDVDSQFVFWKTEIKEEFVPTLEEARPKVVRHLKLKKAIELAKQAGEGIIKQVSGEEQSLQTAFADSEDYDVKDTGQFTWMTFGATPTGQGPPRISFVEGVEFPGEEFMQAVSDLEAGDFVVTQNYPESKAYVVYMRGVTGNDENLRTLYLNEGLKQPVLYMARQDNMRAAADWYMAREKDWDLNWKRTPVNN